MKKVVVNGAADVVRTLSPFVYKDAIKTLEKSNRVGVELNGVPAAKSAVTKGRDVKSGMGGMKYHLYFYPKAGADREWMPISAAEYEAYTKDPAYRFVLTTVEEPAKVEPKPAEPEPKPAEPEPAPAAETPETPAEPEPKPAEPVGRKGRKAERA